ncbi:MAG: hypothetical protein JWP45_2277 [Mucilaginibacter sp.]|nr:hypothetical protein [Mucilaginibacter sp.]
MFVSYRVKAGDIIPTNAKLIYLKSMAIFLKIAHMFICYKLIYQKIATFRTPILKP